MASSSPYSGNDYQAASTFRPYELPVNDIFKAISAQNEFWEIGARKVKSVYDNALNLDLTLDANKEVKKKYMEDAEKQLTRLSSMDLSNPSVQRQGLNIYKPLFKDEAIMYDSQLTSTLKGIYGDADTYRRKKLSSTGVEGEGYTDRNLAFSLDGFEGFNSKTPRDPEMLKEMYGKLGNRKYSPYYNPTKEYANILKNCKGSATEEQDVAGNYMYFDNFSKTGANSSETANCFMMGLSEQAKAQIGIDGWAYYKSNPELLAADHREFALGKHKQAVDAIQGRIEGIKAGGVTKEEQESLKELEDLLPQLQTNYNDRVKEYEAMIGGDGIKYVTQNFQTLAKGIYLSKNYAALGEAFKSDITAHKLTANGAGIAQFNALARSHEAELDRRSERENLYIRAQLARKMKQDAGEIPEDYVGTWSPNVDDDTDNGQNNNENQFILEKDKAFDAYSNAYRSLASYIKSKNPNQNPNELNDAFLINFANQQGKKKKEDRDKQFSELMEVYNNTKGEFSQMDMKQKAIETTVDNQFANDEDYKKLKASSVTLRDGTFLSGSNLRQVRRIPVYEYMGEGAQVFSRYKYIYNGKEYDNDPLLSILETKNTDDYKAIDNLFSKFDDISTSMASARDKLYKATYFEAQRFTDPRVNPSKNPAIDMKIKNALGVSGGLDEKNGYKLLGHDIDGQNLIVVPLDENGKEDEIKLKRIVSYDVNNKEIKVGHSIHAVQIPFQLPELADVPTQKQKFDISGLRDFQVLMQTQLRNKAPYFSSDNLKNADGTTFPYTNYTFKTPSGSNVKVKATMSNGQLKLVPSVQTKDGGWDDNYQSFSSPDELILYFRKY